MLHPWSRLLLIGIGLSIPAWTPLLAASNSPPASALAWDKRFYFREVSGPVTAMLADGTNLYVGGTFKRAGKVAAHGIVRWDGTTWAALGSGLGGHNGFFSVQTIARLGHQVFVGGEFTSAGGVTATNVARWDGTNWSVMGGGFSDGAIWDLETVGNDLYAAGFFTNVAGLNATHVARWDGNQWFALPAGPTNGYVLGLATFAGSLYVGGTFTSVVTPQGVQPCGVARWDGTAWSAVGLPFNGPVWALRWHQGQLFVGGEFTPSVNQPGRYIARWTGTQWAAVGSSLLWQGGEVVSLGTYQGDLIASGRILDQGIAGYARWNGVSWSGFGNAFNFPAYRGSAVTEFQGQLYAGDNLPLYGGGSQFDPNPLARWTGTAWETVQSEPGNGIQGSVYAVAASGRDAYVAGRFDTAGSVAATNIARWNGTNWNPLGAGLPSAVGALAVANGWVYAGNQDGAWRWDGTNWISLPGLSGVTALAAQGTNVYANHLGFFGDAVGRGIMTWNGVEWVGLGGGLTMTFGFEFYHPIRSIAASDNDVYITGEFTAVGGVDATNVARWNGTSWSALGSGLDSPWDLAVGPQSVYALDSWVVREWNGSQWSALGNQDGQVEKLAIVDGELIAAGAYLTGADGEVRQLRRWNGTDWLSFGPEENGEGVITRLAVAGANIVVGGSFISLGNTSAGNFGIGYLRPPLRIEALEDQVILSWPTQALGFVLQTATAFPALDWQTVAQAPQEIGNRYSVVLDAGDARRYFRLYWP